MSYLRLDKNALESSYVNKVTRWSKQVYTSKQQHFQKKRKKQTNVI